MRGMIALKIAFIVCTIAVAAPMSASADETTKRCGKTGKCYVIAKREPTAGMRKSSKVAGNGDDRAQEARKNFAAALAVYDRQLARYRRCFLANPNGAGCGRVPKSPWLGGERGFPVQETRQSPPARQPQLPSPACSCPQSRQVSVHLPSSTHGTSQRSDIPCGFGPMVPLM
jgi:hypothetical protein